MIKGLLFFSTLLYLPAVLGNSSIYTTADLNVLAQSKNYREYLDHALDVKPSNRDKKWEEQLEKVALDYLDFITDQRRTNESDLERLKKLSSWRLFYNNEFFTKKRDTYFLKDIKNCLTEKLKDCNQKVDSYFLDYEHDFLFSRDLITLLNQYPKQFKDLWPYAKPLLKNTLSEFYCDKAPIKDLIIEKIMSSQDVAPIKSSIHKDCLKVIMPELKAFLTDKSENIREKAFGLLKESEKLGEKDKSLYNTYSFLSDKTINNKEVDSIVSSLKHLKNNPKERTEVLNELKTWPQFPDFAFAQADSSLKIKIINRYFPEILDYYTKTCLDYLQGKKEFVKGNPTPNCHKYFHSVKGLNIVTETQLYQYKKATKYLK